MPAHKGPEAGRPGDEVALSRFHITPDEIRCRLEFLGFAEADRANLSVLAAVIAESVSSLIEDFYRHLFRFDPLRKILADPARLERLKQTQRSYLLTIGQLPDQADYIEQRLRIGLAHERAGLDQKWYLGAYSALFELIARRLIAQLEQKPERISSVLCTLEKLFKLDQTLVVETYHHATTERLAASLSQLRETHRQLEEVSRLDELTHVLNRRSLMEELEKELERSRRYLRPFSLLFLDVDHFKAVNDRHGHQRGDVVLQWIVRLIAGMLRPPDILGRYGGEEFAVGLIECDEQRARAIAERVRAAVAEDACVADGQTIAVTVSIGISHFGPGVSGLEALLKQADVALYQAKANGRNRVESYRPS
jgi:diguanylate cyclase (GGDEF)-like protein